MVDSFYEYVHVPDDKMIVRTTMTDRQPYTLIWKSDIYPHTDARAHAHTSS
jgi:hypothetical protein